MFVYQTWHYRILLSSFGTFVKSQLCTRCTVFLELIFFRGRRNWNCQHGHIFYLADGARPWSVFESWTSSTSSCTSSWRTLSARSSSFRSIVNITASSNNTGCRQCPSSIVSLCYSSLVFLNSYSSLPKYHVRFTNIRWYNVLINDNLTSYSKFKYCSSERVMRIHHQRYFVYFYLLHS